MKLFLIIYLYCTVVFFFVTLKNFDCFAVTPKEIYEINNFNMLAATLLFIVSFLLNPFFYVAKFLWWIFHISRNDD